MLHNLEIVGTSPGADAVAVFDASADQLAALGYAASHHLRWRFGGESLEVDETLCMRVLVGVADQLAELVAADGHGTVSVTATGAALLHEAVSTYLTMRDLEEHQSPQERERLTLLGGLAEPLAELCAAFERTAASSGGSDQPLCAA